MKIVNRVVRRLRGDDVRALRAEVAELQRVVLVANHNITEMLRLMSDLHHDVRSGSAAGLPLFLGYAERFRADADTTVGATVVIDRQLAVIEEQVERLVAAAADARPR